MSEPLTAEEEAVARYIGKSGWVRGWRLAVSEARDLLATLAAARSEAAPPDLSEKHANLTCDCVSWDEHVERFLRPATSLTAAPPDLAAALTDVLANHRDNRSDMSGDPDRAEEPGCVIDGQPWPCDAYRLATLSPTEREAPLDAALRELTARLAIVNHITNEDDDCTADETVEWCDPCWQAAEKWLALDATYPVAVQARGALADRFKEPQP